MIETREFLDFLWSNGVRKIYLSHDPRAPTPAIKLSKLLRDHGFMTYIGYQIRPYGKEIVGQTIAQCDLTIVVNPTRDNEKLLIELGKEVIELSIEEV